MHYLFSYGTLQKPDVQLKLFGRFLQGEKDKLLQYKTAFIEITDEAFLAKGEEKMQQTLTATNHENDFVEGTAFQVSGEELLHADKYEPVNYKRIQVKPQSGKAAWIYIAG